MKGGTSYDIHAERVTEAPIAASTSNAFNAWMEDWKDRIQNREHVVEGTAGQGLAGVIELPGFRPEFSLYHGFGIRDIRDGFREFDPFRPFRPFEPGIQPSVWAHDTA